MAVLINLALLCILGILQVSSQQKGVVLSGNIPYEVQCFKKTLALIEGNPGYVKAIYNDLSGKQEAMNLIKEITSEGIYCCGKESEAKKCLDDKVFPLLVKLVEVLFRYNRIYGVVFTESLARIGAYVTFAENEIECCCPSGKYEACVPKFDFPTSSFKADIKECKGEGIEGFYYLLKKLNDYHPKLYTIIKMEEQLVKYYESLYKYKEVIPKDGKCKEEKALAPLIKELRNLRLILSLCIQYQVSLNFEYEQIKGIAASFASKLVEYPISRELKQIGY